MGATLYFSLEKHVTVVVDGQPRAVRTFRMDVRGLLRGLGVALGPHDKVVPPVEASLDEGMQIQVLHAKEISLVLGGVPRTVWVTGKTVEDVLDQINLRLGRADYVSRGRRTVVEPGDVIEFREAVAVQLAVDGERIRVITNAPDVGYMLDSLGVVLRRHDMVRPRVTTPLFQGAQVHVTRVMFRELTEQGSIPYRTETRPTDSLFIGESRIERYGVTGLRQATYRVRYEDGAEVERELGSNRLVRQAVSQIVLVGTRDPQTAEGVASWYDMPGMTAAHRWLPKGTRVRVTNLATGGQVVVIINDRGPYVEGRIIDLSDEAFEQLAPLSVGTIRVRIEW